QRAAIVAAVILPVQRRLIRKLLWLNKVLKAKFCSVHPELMSHKISHALDSVDGLGHSERATIGDSTRRFVCIDAVHFHVRSFQIIGSGADVKQTRWEL